MPKSHRSSALVFTAALVALVGACASTGEQPVVRDHELLECPHFIVTAAPITVPTGNQWGFPIGGGHRIDFTQGAVPMGSQYQISAGPNAPANGGTVGEIRIEPLGGAPPIFDQEVFLTLNTAGCQDVPGSNLMVVMTKDGTSKPIGGWYPQGRTFVRVLIPHLTTFALAR